MTESPLKRRLCLRTPGTAIAVVNDNKIPPEGGTPNAFTVKLTRDYKDKALGVPAFCVRHSSGRLRLWHSQVNFPATAEAGILRATKSRDPGHKVRRGWWRSIRVSAKPLEFTYRNFNQNKLKFETPTKLQSAFLRLAPHSMLDVQCWMFDVQIICLVTVSSIIQSSINPSSSRLYPLWFCTF